jgi:hypothetical protein
MKRILPLHVIGMLTFLGALAPSCIDNAYDWNNLDPEAVLFKNSLSMPVGRARITLDSAIGGIGIDTSILRVENNTYIFGYSGSFNLDNLTESLNDFQLASIEDIESTILLYDGTTGNPGVDSIPLPPQTQTFNGNMTLDLPSFSTSLIQVDSLLLQNTIIQISLETSGIGGPKLNSSASITFTAQGDGAEYYVNGEKKTSWTMDFGETAQVEIRKLNLTSGSNSLTLAREVLFDIKEAGDVMVSTSEQSSLNVKIAYPNGVDFKTAYGKIDKSLQGSVSPIHFDALGDILAENDVLDFYNPTINISSSGNLGVPVNMIFNMTASNSSTGASASLENTDFTINAAPNSNTDVESSRVIDKENGTSDLFKVNPNLVQMDYDVQTDTSHGYFIAKDTHLSLSYAMDIPLQFGDELSISVGSTILENPLEDNMDDVDDQDSLDISILLNIKNQFPLRFRLSLTALDKDSVELFTVETGVIESAPIDAEGFANGSTLTETSITLDNSQINQLKNTSGFRPTFVLQTNPDYPFVTVKPSDFIEMSIGAKAIGGIKLQLDPETLSN